MENILPSKQDKLELLLLVADHNSNAFLKQKSTNQYSIHVRTILEISIYISAPFLPLPHDCRLEQSTLSLHYSTVNSIYPLRLCITLCEFLELLGLMQVSAEPRRRKYVYDNSIGHQ